MQRTPFTALFRLWPRTALGVLLAALLWAQMLGQVHGVLHARLAPSTSISLDVVAATASAVPHADVLGHMRAPADDDSKCRLFDQLGHAGPASYDVPIAPQSVVWWPAWVAQTSLLPTFCAAFAARAPPASF